MNMTQLPPDVHIPGFTIAVAAWNRHCEFSVRPNRSCHAAFRRHFFVLALPTQDALDPILRRAVADSLMLSNPRI